MDVEDFYFLYVSIIGDTSLVGIENIGYVSGTIGRSEAAVTSLLPLMANNL